MTCCAFCEGARVPICPSCLDAIGARDAEVDRLRAELRDLAERATGLNAYLHNYDAFHGHHYRRAYGEWWDRPWHDD